MKKVIAVLFLQLYLISAFGITLGQQFCCDTHIMDECHLTDYPLHHHDIAAEESDEHCPLCVVNETNPENKENITPDSKNESCCSDCETLTVTVSESKKQQTELNNVLDSRPLKIQAAELVLCWIPELPRLSYLSISEPLRDDISSIIPYQIPLFIKGCTYRL